MSFLLTSDLVARVRDSGARTIALQFPEGLKRRAFEVAHDLREQGFEVIVSGDPCWGACDLALDALAMADILIHFGHAPVEERTRVIYEYVEFEIDPAVLDRALPLLSGTTVALVTTIQHVHLLDAMASYLESKGIHCLVGDGGDRTPFRGQVLGCSFESARVTGAKEILFVGTGLFHPLGVQLATEARVIALDPYTGIAIEVDARPLLKKRFARIERARTAERIGILLSTKSGQERMELARKLANMSEKAFIIAIREVTPDALLNLGFDCYVNTACPRLAYDDQIRFPAPVLSPPEFEIVCGLRSWEQYTIDEIR